MRMLREALRLGEVELKVVRPEAVHSKQKALFSKNNFVKFFQFLRLSFL